MSSAPSLFHMGGVLNDIRVIEQGTFITGPCAGMMLADLGAAIKATTTRRTSRPTTATSAASYST